VRVERAEEQVDDGGLTVTYAQAEKAAVSWRWQRRFAARARMTRRLAARIAYTHELLPLCSWALWSILSLSLLSWPDAAAPSTSSTKLDTAVVVEVDDRDDGRADDGWLRLFSTHREKALASFPARTRESVQVMKWSFLAVRSQSFHDPCAKLSS
jgi:hypothetical protein